MSHADVVKIVYKHTDSRPSNFDDREYKSPPSCLFSSSLGSSLDVSYAMLFWFGHSARIFDIVFGWEVTGKLGYKYTPMIVQPRFTDLLLGRGSVSLVCPFVPLICIIYLKFHCPVSVVRPACSSKSCIKDWRYKSLWHRSQADEQWDDYSLAEIQTTSRIENRVWLLWSLLFRCMMKYVTNLSLRIVELFFQIFCLFIQSVDILW